MVFGPAKRVPVVNLPLSLKQSRAALISCIQLNLVETVLSFATFAIKRGGSVKVMGSFNIIFIAFCAIGLHGALALKPMWIVFHSATLTALIGLFLGYMILLALIGSAEWWLIIIVAGFTVTDLISARFGIKLTMDLIAFEKQVDSDPSFLLQPEGVVPAPVPESLLRTAFAVSSSAAVSPRKMTYSEAALSERKTTVKRLEELNLLADAPVTFKCPITQCLMVDPVILSDGQTYEREGIERWLQTKKVSPVTNLRLGPNLFPNLGKFDSHTDALPYNFRLRYAGLPPPSLSSLPFSQL